VILHLGKEVTVGILRKSYDAIVVATYANQNLTFGESDDRKTEYKYMLCEKPVVRLPKEFDGKSVVIMDGPFMCVDPFGSTGLFLLGNVVHAIHERAVGHCFRAPARLRRLLNRGVVPNPPVTNFKKFIDSGSKFIPRLGRAEHVGSMFTVRTIFPGMERTDARPTVVTSIDRRVISIFSGKIPSCVGAARQAAKLLD
jgi:hypothetical protein